MYMCVFVFSMFPGCFVFVFFWVGIGLVLEVLICVVYRGSGVGV